MVGDNRDEIFMQPPGGKLAPSAQSFWAMSERCSLAPSAELESSPHGRVIFLNLREMKFDKLSYNTCTVFECSNLKKGLTNTFSREALTALSNDA